jgi:ethanolamine utilization microcompartment shell protein EutL
LGKSTGKGALGIWTHNLNSTEMFLNYTSRAYTGAALKMGAGMQAGAAYAFAHRPGYRVVCCRVAGERSEHAIV